MTEAAKIMLEPGTHTTLFIKNGRIVQDDSTDGEAWTIDVDVPVTITITGPYKITPRWRYS